MLNFKSIEISDKKEIDQYLSKSTFIGTEACFAILFCWRFLYNYKYAVKDGFLFIKINYKGRILYLPPIGEDQTVDKSATKNAIEIIMKDAENENTPLVIVAIDEDNKKLIEKIFPNKFLFEKDRDGFDYIHNQQDLETLVGKKFHSQRNHINKFNLLYPEYKIEAITADNFKECLKMNIEWCKANGLDTTQICTGNNYELCAVNQAFKNYDTLGCKGILLRIDGKVVAFTVGTERNSDVFVIHFEKALYEYDGAYKVINQEFAKTLSSYKYINREEDMGNEGLRRAKMSYNPVFLLVKYYAELK